MNICSINLAEYVQNNLIILSTRHISQKIITMLNKKILNWIPDTIYSDNKIILVNNSGSYVGTYELSILKSIFCLSELEGTCNISRDLTNILEYLRKKMLNVTTDFVVLNNLDFRLYIYTSNYDGYKNYRNCTTTNTKLGKKIRKPLYMYQINLRFDKNNNLIDNKLLVNYT